MSAAFGGEPVPIGSLAALAHALATGGLYADLYRTLVRQAV